ncbi:MAG: thiamine diphosphokinase [Acidobacteriota bacterium]
MKILIMANGHYGDLEWYRENASDFNRIICADGGAVTARLLGIRPNWVVGDLDSISLLEHKYLEEIGAEVYRYPAEKNETDMQLALQMAKERGASEIVIWGGTGARLDHTLSSLFSTISLLEYGIKVCFEQPEGTIHMADKALVISGVPGDTVSIIVLEGPATGVTLKGFKYLLNDAVLHPRWQYAISNIMAVPEAQIVWSSGTLAVFHYRILPE